MESDTIDRARVREIRKRRTFAIISHPDAGKTTLTEKLLLFGGAIQQAGAGRPCPIFCPSSRNAGFPCLRRL
jgi:hypothetical protein